MKKNFISHVSHELKAPLASMQETTHLMLEQIPGPLTEKQKRLLDLNLQSGKRLAQMIGNILDLSRLEAGIVEYDIQRSGYRRSHAQRRDGTQFGSARTVRFGFLPTFNESRSS